MKKVLIITYYWPPSGGAGVQRWLYFAKYLREFGWEPIIFTPENPSYPSEDLSFVKEVPEGIQILKYPIWEPYSFYKKFLGMKKGANVQHAFLQETKTKKWKNTLSIWIRSNFFIPDARKFWIKPASKYLVKNIKDINPNIIISTGPPHSCHMIGLKIHEKTGIPWIADFRDPWTEIAFAHELKLSVFAENRHKILEKKVLNQSSKVIIVGWHMMESLRKISNRNQYKVITNGYDFQEFTNEIKPSRKFQILHVGSMNMDRNPWELWQVLDELSKVDNGFASDVEIKLIGKYDYQIENEIQKYNLDKFSNFIDYIPHGEIFDHLKKAQILLLALNRIENVDGIITGKIFEYLVAKRPILCIGSESGDAAKILSLTDAGIAVNFKDTKKVKKAIVELYQDFKQGKSRFRFTNIDQFSRRALTKELTEVMNGLSSNNSTG